MSSVGVPCTIYLSSPINHGGKSVCHVPHLKFWLMNWLWKIFAEIFILETHKNNVFENLMAKCVKSKRCLRTINVGGKLFERNKVNVQFDIKRFHTDRQPKKAFSINKATK